MNGIALVTIGQSPRQDLVAHTDITVPVLQAGALDLVNDKRDLERIEWKPGDSDLPLSTQYDGETVLLRRRALVPLLQRALESVEARGTETVSILCTESFPELRSRGTVVRIDRLIKSALNEAARNAGPLSVCVFVPTVGQVVPVEARWNLFVSSQVFELDPYATNETICRVCTAAVEGGRSFNLALLDCMGYGKHVKRVVESELGCPVISPPQLLGEHLHRLGVVKEND